MILEYDIEMTDPKDFDVLFEHLAWAEQKNYINLQHEVARHIIDCIFFNVAFDNLDWKTGLKHLPNLVQNLLDLKLAHRAFDHISAARVRSLPGIVRLYEILLEEAFRKRKVDHVSFFEKCIHVMFFELHAVLECQVDLELYMSLLKFILKWRLVMPNENWRINNLHDYARLLAVLDEEVRDIFYPGASFKMTMI